MPRRPDARPCEGCGTTFHPAPNTRGRFCSRQCANVWVNGQRRIRHADDVQVQRGRRELAAPGLTKTQMIALRKRWVRQGARCTYCPALATSVDHIVPLVRGGTNYEGNLAPCCRSCNCSKSGYLIVEWRTGLRLNPMTQPLAWARTGNRTPRAPKVKAPKPERPTRGCALCGMATIRPVYCSDTCQLEAHARRTRDKYRAAHGMTVDKNAPTKPRKRMSCIL